MLLHRERVDALADAAEERAEVLAGEEFALEPQPFGDRNADVDVHRPRAAADVGQRRHAGEVELLFADVARTRRR